MEAGGSEKERVEDAVLLALKVVKGATGKECLESGRDKEMDSC